jgi:nucleotide-binding universal stress UspA family protein
MPVALSLNRKEKKTMAQKILVPLRRYDRIEEIVPYLEEVTQPGMSIVFFIQHSVNGFKWLQAYCAIMECGTRNSVALTRMAESYSVETRRHLAEQRVFQTCKDLQRLGVKVAVEVYSGSRRKALRTYVRSEKVDLIVMRSGIALRFMRVLQRSISFWSAFGRAAFPPGFLRHPGK